MSCCIETLMAYQGEDDIGTVLPCSPCGGSLILAQDGVWEWNRQ